MLKVSTLCVIFSLVLIALLGERTVVFGQLESASWQLNFEKILHDWAEPKASLYVYHSQTHVHKAGKVIAQSSSPSKGHALEVVGRYDTAAQMTRKFLHQIQRQVGIVAHIIVMVNRNTAAQAWTVQNGTAMGQEAMVWGVDVLISQIEEIIGVLSSLESVLDLMLAAWDIDTLELFSKLLDRNQTHFGSLAKHSPLRVMRMHLAAARVDVGSAIRQLEETSKDLGQLRGDVASIKFGGSLPFKFPDGYTMKNHADA